MRARGRRVAGDSSAGAWVKKLLAPALALKAHWVPPGKMPRLSSQGPGNSFPGMGGKSWGRWDGEEGEG